jgi:ubiquinone/menaquinone biosynthesis C-methylase UbiE
MKIRDSGMPDEGLWQTFFDEEEVLDRMGVRDLAGDIVDLGCGYGSFAVPAARRTDGTVHAYDIEEAMVAATRRRAEALGMDNLIVVQRDLMMEGTGLPPESCEVVMAFNILHAEEPLRLLAEAWRILQPGGRVTVVHWIPDPTTPRGPALEIRPRPEQCRAWMEAVGFAAISPVIALPPYHFGLVGVRR